MKLSKLTGLLLVMGLLVPLAACDSASEEPVIEEPAIEEPAPETEPEPAPEGTTPPDAPAEGTTN
ncbi:hypothetical protein GS597_00360 [Synechococcales cyanobacterium C]|uniref:Uncharacterized protein n=1 Tax=Petrachloros mirabilis ULC683 TaxID=2781853 RepID=A0A8K1ZW67_9CYAN|nr:hypothetical protein [Petrachloros mirabilis]NCJ04997.1 hypothetical protein [Petrachloros mirabilis ULC683]